VKTIASRAALTALVLLAALTTTMGAALARRAPAAAAPTAEPTPTPIYVPLTPPPSGPPAPVAAPQPALAESGPCANDKFLSFRAIPMPVQTDAMVCGIVTSTSPSGSFKISIDGTQPLVIEGSNLPAVHAGDKVAVKGRYHRDKTGAEGIDVGRAGSTQSSSTYVTVLAAASH
jgi:hypothetical protein